MRTTVKENNIISTTIKDTLKLRRINGFMVLKNT